MSAECSQQRQRWHRRARHALAHSLRVRLMTLFLVLALVMAGTFLLGMQYALSIGWRDAARPLVVDYVDRLAADIGSPPSLERATALAQRLPLSVRISGPAVNWRSHPDAPEFQHGRSFGRRWNQDELRFFERSTADGHKIVFGVDVKAWHDRPRFAGWATLAVLLALTALAYARVRRLLRPLDDIRAGALRFGAGDFGQPIAVRCPSRPDELGELAATINTMGADIRQMLDAKRGLLLAISHELRSPLTRARLNTELLPETPEVKPGRDALLRDLALMRDLVTGLLESERLASRHAALQLEPADLGNLVREVVQEMSASNPAAQRVTVNVSAAVPVQMLDGNRMRLLVRNLLDNALRHSAESARPPEVSVSAQGPGLMLAVRDYGPGVEEAALAHLAEPFYRPDSARTRATGGVGLGLYLCRLVAQAHGGSLVVRNAHPGLEARVLLPA